MKKSRKARAAKAREQRILDRIEDAVVAARKEERAAIKDALETQRALFEKQSADGLRREGVRQATQLIGAMLLSMPSKDRAEALALLPMLSGVRQYSPLIPAEEHADSTWHRRTGLEK